MNKETLLYDDGEHQCIMFSFDEERDNERFLSTNQYLIINKGCAILIDPGSHGIFDDMVDAIEQYIPLDHIRFIFFSHQDPDVAGALDKWTMATPAKIVISSLWVRFLGHYGLLDMNRIIALEDKGGMINFEEDFFQFVPAHFLHSPGNFSLFDSRSGILFSGDIGTAIVEIDKLYKEVENFEEHCAYLEPFHKRYMAGNSFARRWVNEVRTLHVKLIAPQHGAIFKEAHVDSFLHWFENLPCGNEIINTLYHSENAHAETTQRG